MSLRSKIVVLLLFLLASFFVFTKRIWLSSFIVSDVSAPLTDISQLRFESSSVSYLLSRVEGSDGYYWIMREPQYGLVQTAFVGEALSLFQQFEFGRPVESTNTPRDIFGLSSPESKLMLTSQSGAVFSILFGKRNEYLARRYVQIENAASIYAPADILLPQLLQDPSSFVESQPLEPLLEGLQWVSYPNGVRLSESKGIWLVNGERADQPFAREYLRRLTHLEVTGYREGAPNADSPYLSIELLASRTEQRPITFDFYGQKGEKIALLRASHLPVTMEVSRAKVDRIQPSIESLHVTEG